MVTLRHRILTTIFILAHTCGVMSESSRRFRRHALGTLAAALLVTTAACGGESTGAAEAGGPAAGSSGEGKPQLVASFYPLQWLTERVGGPDVTVTGLTQPGVEPHDLELTPRQVSSIEQADLTVYLKGVQPAVDEAVEQHAADKGFDAATAASTLPAEEEEHEEGEEEHGHEVDYDPHLWLDPARFAEVAKSLGDRLATADAAHAQGYKDRAAATAAELTALDEEMKTGLADCARRTVVTSHTAFGYLADRYDLKQVGISGIDPESEPSPARLAEVAKVAKQEKVTTIFTETLVSPKVAEVLAAEVGAKTAVLDPVEGRPEGGDYLSAMRANLAELRTALGCK
jgi:zinc transport system substrate-binding protein